jgi:outer membrane immunogenic protein
MKGATLLVAVTLALASAASAADLPTSKPAPMPPPQPLPTWTGFYIGAQGGGGWGNSDETYFLTPNTAAFVGTQNYNVSGGMVGGLIGYNYQINSFVLGAQADYNGANISGRSNVINTGLSDTYFTQINSYGDVKGLAGYAFGPALFFVDGGFAFGALKHRYDAAGNGGAANSFVNDTTQTGWTIGVGVDYLFAQNWAAGLEYDFVDLGKSSIQYSATPASNRSTWSDAFSVVKATLTYRFDIGAPAPAR